MSEDGATPLQPARNHPKTAFCKRALFGWSLGSGVGGLPYPPFIPARRYNIRASLAVAPTQTKRSPSYAQYVLAPCADGIAIGHAGCQDLTDCRLDLHKLCACDHSLSCVLNFVHAPLARHRGSGCDRGSDWADILLRCQELAVVAPLRRRLKTDLLLEFPPLVMRRKTRSFRNTLLRTMWFRSVSLLYVGLALFSMAVWLGVKLSVKH